MLQAIDRCSKILQEVVLAEDERSAVWILQEFVQLLTSSIDRTSKGVASADNVVDHQRQQQEGARYPRTGFSDPVPHVLSKGPVGVIAVLSNSNADSKKRDGSEPIENDPSNQNSLDSSIDPDSLPE